MTLKTESSLAHSKAFSFILKEFVCLLDSQQADDELPFSNTDKVTYITDENGNIISASVWVYVSAKRSGYILFSATHKDHRNKGHYKKIYFEVEKKLKAFGAVNVYSSAAVSNTNMILIAKSMNRMPKLVRLKKELQ